MKNLKNLGKTLSKNEQKLIHGGGPTAADIAAGFPRKCEGGGAYLVPACNNEQQSLSDSGDSYWSCVCGHALDIWNDGPTEGNPVHSPSGYPYGGIG